jgi:hypothetical protein
MAKTKVDPLKKRHEPIVKSTQQGRGLTKTSSMNKHTKRNYKKYRGQGR